jgi:hypothetical protein
MFVSEEGGKFCDRIGFEEFAYDCDGVGDSDCDEVED